MASARISRRSMLAGSAAFAGMALAGWSAGGFAKTPRPVAMTMHRGPGCGCCLKWVDAARAAGFTVDVVDDPNLYAFKTKHGVPQSLFACHTTLAGDYVIEGHVPFDSVRKLLAERPNVRGIAVAGMPIGSPGMEHEGHPAEPIQVYAFDSAGRVLFFG